MSKLSTIQKLPRISRRGFVRTVTGTAVGLTGGWIARSAHGAGGTDQLSGLDDYCRQALSDWKVPGLALAVIRDGEIVLARGYGVRELGKNAPVNENTVFSIASCTKSFTAAMLGKLVDQNKLRWDDFISHHLPELTAFGEAGRPEPSLRHALQHRTGLPSSNMLWRSGVFTADEILNRILRLTPLALPGEKFIYNNVMYLAAARAAERASGWKWNDFIQAEFFEPLEMRSTLPDNAQLASLQNVAVPHATVDGQVMVAERYCPNVIAPAGAIHSTAADMARWLVLHLQRGRFAGRPVLSAERIDEMHRPIEPGPAESRPTGVPRAPIHRYGLGWFVNDHAEKRVVEHSGVQNGFVSWMAMIPQTRMGVVILSNHHRSGINSALRSWVFDRLLGRPEYDWSNVVLKDHTNGWQRLLREAKADFERTRLTGAGPSLPLSDYIGTYESPVYGAIYVTKTGSQLELQFGTRFRGRLIDWERDSFRAFFPNPRLDDWLVKFNVDDKRVGSLEVQEAPWAPQWYEDRDDLGNFDRQ